MKLGKYNSNSNAAQQTNRADQKSREDLLKGKPYMDPLKGCPYVLTHVPDGTYLSKYMSLWNVLKLE